MSEYECEHRVVSWLDPSHWPDRYVCVVCHRKFDHEEIAELSSIKREVAG